MAYGSPLSYGPAVMEQPTLNLIVPVRSGRPTHPAADSPRWSKPATRQPASEVFRPAGPDAAAGRRCVAARASASRFPATSLRLQPKQEAAAEGRRGPFPRPAGWQHCEAVRSRLLNHRIPDVMLSCLSTNEKSHGPLARSPWLVGFTLNIYCCEPLRQVSTREFANFSRSVLIWGS
jgi:hypothetical protein